MPLPSPRSAVCSFLLNGLRASGSSGAAATRSPSTRSSEGRPRTCGLVPCDSRPLGGIGAWRNVVPAGSPWKLKAGSSRSTYVDVHCERRPGRGRRLLRAMSAVTAVMAWALASTSGGAANSEVAASTAGKSVVVSTTASRYPLRMGPNHRYLVDRKGNPFLIVGDSPQALIVKVTPADADRFLADRASKGFNAIWVIFCATTTPAAHRTARRTTIFRRSARPGTSRRQTKRTSDAPTP